MRLKLLCLVMVISLLTACGSSSSQSKAVDTPSVSANVPTNTADTNTPTTKETTSSDQSPVQKSDNAPDKTVSQPPAVARPNTTAPSVAKPTTSAPAVAPTTTKSISATQPAAQTPAVSKPAPVQPEVKEVTVYITRTGEKYHRDGCRYLRQSKIPVSLDVAKSQGYEPCSVCNPPR